MPLVIPIFIPHRGCPHDCLFCNQQKISGGERQSTCSGIPGRQIRETIREWLARSRGKDSVEVAFFGGSFTCLPRAEMELFLDIVQPFIAEGKVHSIRCSTRPDCVDNTVCSLLKDKGVKTVELGVQSLSEPVLRAARRGHTVADSVAAVRLLKYRGFVVGVQLMPGLPGETRSSFLQGVNRVIALQPDFVRLYPALVVKGAGLEPLFAQGRYQPLSLGAATVLTARCYEKFTDNGIPVVRMGLQPSKSLAENVVAGPYHPSFGELVRSRLLLREIKSQLSKLDPGEKLEIVLSHRDLSTAVGIKKMNIRKLDSLGYAGRYAFIVDKLRERGIVDYVVCNES